jgi:hypothetical protein
MAAIPFTISINWWRSSVLRSIDSSVHGSAAESYSCMNLCILNLVLLNLVYIQLYYEGFEHVLNVRPQHKYAIILLLSRAHILKGLERRSGMYGSISDLKCELGTLIPVAKILFPRPIAGIQY